MKKFFLVLFLPLFLLFSGAVAQQNPVSIKLKIAEKSGLFNMGDRDLSGSVSQPKRVRRT